MQKGHVNEYSVHHEIVDECLDNYFKGFYILLRESFRYLEPSLILVDELPQGNQDLGGWELRAGVDEG